MFSVITCPPVPLWSTLRANTTSNIVGASALTTCDVTAEGNPTYFLDNRTEHIVTCHENGVWSPQVLECVRVAGARRVEEAPTEAGNGVSFGIISVCLILLVVIVCLASDIPAYKHTLVVLRRRLSDVSARFF